MKTSTNRKSYFTTHSDSFIVNERNSSKIFVFSNIFQSVCRDILLKKSKMNFFSRMFHESLFWVVWVKIKTKWCALKNWLKILLHTQTSLKDTGLYNENLFDDGPNGQSFIEHKISNTTTHFWQICWKP